MTFLFLLRWLIFSLLFIFVWCFWHKPDSIVPRHKSGETRETWMCWLCVWVLVFSPNDPMLFKTRPIARISISLFSLMLRCVETKWGLRHLNHEVHFISLISFSGLRFLDLLESLLALSVFICSLSVSVSVRIGRMVNWASSDRCPLVLDEKRERWWGGVVGLVCSLHLDDFSLEKSVSGQPCCDACVCAWVRQVACVSVCISLHVCVTSVIGCRCRAHSSASDLVEIWDQRCRSAC